MDKTSKSITDQGEVNLNLLNAYWRRSSFHDEGVESVTPSNRRLVITLDSMILVLSGVTNFKQKFSEELPTMWLDHSLTAVAGGHDIKVVCDTGEFRAQFTNLRLIRRSDMAILIPPLDP